MKRFNKVKGFTLVEIMIVIGIIGILVAFAVPAYQSYAGRAQAAEALVISTAAKSAVVNDMQTEGVYPGANTFPKVDDLAVTGKYGSLTVAADTGVITVSMNDNNVAEDLQGKDIVFTPSFANGAFTWTCVTTIEQTALNPKGCTKS